MKKVVLFAAVAAMISFASCGKKGAEATTTDSLAVDSAAIETVATDSTAMDSVAVDSTTVDSVAVQ